MTRSIPISTSPRCARSRADASSFARFQPPHSAQRIRRSWTSATCTERFPASLLQSADRKNAIGLASTKVFTVMHLVSVEEALSTCATLGDRLWSGNDPSASVASSPVTAATSGAGTCSLLSRPMPCFGLIGKGLHSEYLARGYEASRRQVRCGFPLWRYPALSASVEPQELTSRRARMRIDGILLKAMQWPN